MKLTVEWLLTGSGLSDLRCVAGKSNLSNRLSSINVLDNADVLRWVSKDEFAMTTGYFLKDDEQAQVQIIKDLKQAGSSGLGIKIKRFFDHIPQRMTDTADEVGLPLIEIPYYYRFSEISNSFFVSAHNAEIKERSRVPELLINLSEIYFNGSGLGQMLTMLSEELECICMISRLNSIISYHIPTALLGQFKTAGNTDEIKSAGYVSENNRRICRFRINRRTISFVEIPLPGSTGTLLIEKSCDESDIKVARTTVHLFAMELEKMKNISHDITRSSYYDMFYEMLLDSSQRTNDNLRMIYNYYGFNSSMKRVCMTIRLKENHNTAENMKNISSAVVDLLDQNRISRFTCSHLNDISIFVYFSPDAKVAAAVSDCISIGEELYSAICRALNVAESELPCVIGIGRCHKKINTVSTAYNDSVKAIQMSSVEGEPRHVCTYFSQMPYHVLSVMSSEELYKIYHDSIKQLVEYDEENGSDLVNTLKTFFSCKFNATETARKLFLHRNTFARRMDRIKSILRVDMTDTDEMISLYLGICAKELLDSE